VPSNRFHPPALRLLGGPRLRRFSPLLTALALLVLVALPAQASWMLPGLPYRPKDFTLVKHDGLYHLFYIRHNMTLPLDDTENDLGHAVSADLWNWVQAPPVLAARDTSWDRTHVWAPSVVKRDGVYHLFYTGVSTIPDTCDRWQRTGVATSTDLLNWERGDAPVLACTAVPWTVCDSTRGTTAFRDPFVMPDPAHPGQWLMYYSTFPASDSGGMVVGMARSTGDLGSWSDIGPLWITHRDHSFNDIVESPHLFEHDGLWYAFFTTSAGQPLSFATGPDPTGPPGSWEYRGRLSTMLGVDTAPWFASEHFRDGLVDYFAYVIGDRIDIRRIVWGSPGNFSLVQPALMHVRRMTWSRDSTMQDSTVTLSIVAANWSAGAARLEALRVLAGGSQVPVSLDSLGLPATVTLTGETTHVPWSAAWLPDPSDTTRALDLVVRLTDQTAVAPVLSIVRRPALEVVGLTWADTVVAEGDTARLRVVTRNGPGRSVTLATRRRLGDGSVVAVSADSLGFPATVALSADTTWVDWPAAWLPEEPDTARLLRLVVETADGSATAGELTVIGPEALAVEGLGWEAAEAAAGDTVRLGVVAANWRLRGVDLAAERVLSDGTRAAVSPGLLGLPGRVALTGDTTWVSWASVWLAEAPDTTRRMELVVRVADSSAVAGPLVVVGPERPLIVAGMGWASGVVAEGDTAGLVVATWNGAGRSVALGAWRERGDGTRERLEPERLGLPGAVEPAGDTTRVAWASVWLPEEPDTARLLRLVVGTADSSVLAGPLVVVGPEALEIDSLAWRDNPVAEGDTAWLAVVARNWRLRAVALETRRSLSDGTFVPIAPGLPGSVPLTADTTWVPWVAAWLPEEPDTARLLRLAVRTVDSSRVAEPLVVVGPEPVVVESLAWEGNPVAEGDTARLGIAALNWPRRSVRLATLRQLADGSRVPLPPELPGLPATVALWADTTWVPWPAAWLPEEPDTARLLRLAVALEDSSVVAEPLVVVGPEPVVVESLAWEGNPVAEGDTAELAVVARHWERRSLQLRSSRLLADGSSLPLGREGEGLAETVALTGDTTRVPWVAFWLPEDPDTTRLMRVLARTADSSAVSEPLVVVGPERPLYVLGLTWADTVAAEGDTARLRVVTRNGPGRSVTLATRRRLGDGSVVAVSADSLGFPATVALSADTTWVDWPAAWLPEEPDTARLLRLVVETADGSATAGELTVIGPEALAVEGLGWEAAEAAAGDTVRLGVVAANWRLRGVDLAAERVLSDGTRAAVSPGLLGLPGRVALTGDTTWVSWASVWLAEAPDTTRRMELVVRVADSSAVAGPLVVVGPERPLIVAGMGWASGVVAEGDTAGLVVATWNGAGRSVALGAWRERGDGTRERLEPERLGLPGAVEPAGDTTRVAWASVWLPEEPDTARLLRLVVGTADSSVLAGPLVVVGPERPLRVLALGWDRDKVDRGGTATLAVVAQNWAERSVDLRALRRKADKSLVPVSLDSLGLPGTLALTADTTRLEWVAVWLPEEPDSDRPMDLFLALADSSVVAGQLMVFGPPWPPDSLVEVPAPCLPAALRIESVYPTPSTGALWVCFALPLDAPASLELVDVAGRRLWRRELAPAAGRHVARLGERPLPGGIYFVRLAQAGRHVVARAVVLR
jgi:hypothetical protein